MVLPLPWWKEGPVSGRYGFIAVLIREKDELGENRGSVVFWQRGFELKAGPRDIYSSTAGAQLAEQMLTDTAVDPAAPATTAAARAYAKINLTLQVFGPRGDGYHAIRSLACGIELFDSVSITSGGNGLELFCDDARLRSNGNLAFVAAQRLADRFGIAPCLRISVRKRIPIGGGLGGGSADAAAALRLCRAVLGLNVTDHELAEVGAEVGSDVPLFFHLPSALLTGRGEVVAPIRLGWSGWALLVLAGPLVSTPAVYGAWRRGLCREVMENLEERVASAGSAAEIMALSRNDLESAVFSVSPTVADVYGELVRRGFGPVRVSGAGSVIYRLFDHVEEAESVAAAVGQAGIGTATEVVAVPAGPAPVLFKERLDGDY